MKSKFTAIGIALLLCLPAFALIGGGVAYFTPRQYFSSPLIAPPNGNF